MRNPAVQAEVTEKSFKEWPLLREFRKTDQFQTAFKDIFQKDLADQLLKDAEDRLKEQESEEDESPNESALMSSEDPTLEPSNHAEPHSPTPPEHGLGIVDSSRHTTN